MTDKPDTAVSFVCWMFRGFLALGVVAILLIIGNARAQTAVDVQVECKEGKCVIAEKDLARLLESNNKAVLEVIKLRKTCNDVRV